MPRSHQKRLVKRLLGNPWSDSMGSAFQSLELWRNGGLGHPSHGHWWQQVAVGMSAGPQDVWQGRSESQQPGSSKVNKNCKVSFEPLPFSLVNLTQEPDCHERVPGQLTPSFPNSLTGTCRVKEAWVTSLVSSEGKRTHFWMAIPSALVTTTDDRTAPYDKVTPTHSLLPSGNSCAGYRC